MVIGIESFKEKFKDYTDCYTVIGGAACDILMTDSLEFFMVDTSNNWRIIVYIKSKIKVKIFRYCI